MIKHLIDLWVLKEYGTVIFSKADPLDPDDQCLGGLISALYSFSQSGFGETLFRFTTGKHQYYIVEKHTLLFAGRFPQNKAVRAKQVVRELKKIGERFFKRYTKEEVDNWNHNINKFLGFEEDIRMKQEVMARHIDRLWNHGVTQES